MDLTFQSPPSLRPAPLRTRLARWLAMRLGLERRPRRGRGRRGMAGGGVRADRGGVSATNMDTLQHERDN